MLGVINVQLIIDTLQLLIVDQGLLRHTLQILHPDPLILLINHVVADIRRVQSIFRLILLYLSTFQIVTAAVTLLLRGLIVNAFLLNLGEDVLAACGFGEEV